MQKSLSPELPVQHDAAQVEVDSQTIKSEPVELDAELLKQVGGGTAKPASPYGTW
jgi:hypothetical protein